MILSKNSIAYFQSLQSRIVQAMAKYQIDKPYLYDGEPFFNQYECLRSVWTKRSSIKLACENFNIQKSFYYELENRFIIYGFSGLLFFSDNSKQYLDLEQLALLIRKSRPHISYTAIRILCTPPPCWIQCEKAWNSTEIRNELFRGQTERMML